jgi:hypothetical protein
MQIMTGSKKCKMRFFKHFWIFFLRQSILCGTKINNKSRKLQVAFTRLFAFNQQKVRQSKQVLRYRAVNVQTKRTSPEPGV